MSVLSVPRIIDVADAVHQNLTLDTAKNCLLVYFFARRALKLLQHVRARGFIRSIKDLYLFIAQVRTFAPLPLAQVKTRRCFREPFSSLFRYRLCARKWRQKSMLRGPS